MITIFSIPKPFTGHIGIIQKNAIQSWLAIKPEPQIILFGNETGTDQICKEFNLLHIPEIEQNELGTPKVHSAFNKVSQAALHPLMAYINADIIVTGEIKDILGSVQGRFKEFLMVGRRVDLDVDELLDFSGMGWKQRLLDKADREGILHWSKGSDYFIFNRSVEWKMPAFTTRNGFDNWIIWKARSLNMPVIDATNALTCIHQSHERTYQSIGKKTPDGRDGYRDGYESQENFRLCEKDMNYRYDLLDATHIINQGRVQPVCGAAYVLRRLTSFITGLPFGKTVSRWIAVIFYKTLPVFGRIKYIRGLGCILPFQPMPVPGRVADDFIRKHEITDVHFLYSNVLDRRTLLGRPYRVFKLGEYELMNLPGKFKLATRLYRDSIRYKYKIKWLILLFCGSAGPQPNL